LNVGAGLWTATKARTGLQSRPGGPIPHSKPMLRSSSAGQPMGTQSGRRSHWGDCPTWTSRECRYCRPQGKASFAFSATSRRKIGFYWQLPKGYTNTVSGTLKSSDQKTLKFWMQLLVPAWHWLLAIHSITLGRHLNVSSSRRS